MKPLRMLLSGTSILVAATAVLLLAALPQATIYGNSTCDLPDGPVITEHLEHEAIVAGDVPFTDLLAHGQRLFEAKFNACDGQGRPATTGTGDKRAPVQPAFIRTSAPDAGSCAACHNEPRSGGGGDFVANVFVLAQAHDPVIDTVSPEFSNERNTVGMFGAGPIEMLAREMSLALLTQRQQAVEQAAATGSPVTVALVAKGVNFGQLTAHPDGHVDTAAVEGVDPDLIIKPFHQAGVVVSLREFSNNAFNHHHGMQAEERFDLNPAKGPDFDEDGVERELTVGDITAVAIFQASLGTPGRLLPADKATQEAAARGELLFAQIGCTDCHIPEMRLESRYFVEPNPLNPAGNFNSQVERFAFDLTSQGELPRLERDGEGAIVRAYTDLKRHNLCDNTTDDGGERFYCNERLAQNRPDVGDKPGTEFFITRKLWDVGNSAPYGHRGDLTTISAAIMYHGGEARASRDAFDALPFADQQAVISFLRTLQVLPPGSDLVMVEGEPVNEAPLTAVVPEWLVVLGGGLLAIVALTLLVLAMGWSRRRQYAGQIGSGD